MSIISYLVYWKCKYLLQSNLRNISSLSTWFCTFLSRYLCRLYIYSTSMLGLISDNKENKFRESNSSPSPLTRLLIFRFFYFFQNKITCPLCDSLFSRRLFISLPLSPHCYLICSVRMLLVRSTTHLQAPRTIGVPV